MKNLCLIILLSVMVGCASKSNLTYMGYKVISMPFIIAGDKVIYLPVTDAGVIPAENNGFKMQVAGFTIGKSTTTSNNAELIWNFAFSSTNSESIQSIVIEELAPTKIVKRLANVKNPKIVNGRWKLNLDPIIVNHLNNPWLFRNKASIYVFKITINLESGEQTVLTQAAWFSKSVLSGYAKLISIIENG